MVSSLRRGKRLNLICRGKSTTQAENGSDTKQSVFVFMFFSLHFTILCAFLFAGLGGNTLGVVLGWWDLLHEGKKLGVRGLKGQMLGLQRRGWRCFFCFLFVQDVGCKRQ